MTMIDLPDLNTILRMIIPVLMVILAASIMAGVGNPFKSKGK